MAPQLLLALRPRGRKLRLLLAIALTSVMSTSTVGQTERSTASIPVGTVGGSFEVSGSGSATYRIPIQVPPGRLGIQPRLSLVYDSHAGDGIMGRGWKLEGLSSIRRCPKSVAQHGVRDGVNLTSDDAFCYDDQPLVTSQSQECEQGREFRTLENPFDRICAVEPTKSGDPASFQVFRRDGTIATYGDDPAGVVQTDASFVRAIWPVKRITDRRGNDVTFVYRTSDSLNNEAGEPLDPIRDPGFSIESILYTGHSTLPAARAIRFRYERRPDAITGFFEGVAVRLGYRLASVDVYGPDNRLAHRYTLTYDVAGTLRPLSRLIGLNRCDAHGVCLPSTTFEWAAEQSLRYNGVRDDGPVKALSLADFSRLHIPMFSNYLGSGTGQLLAKQALPYGWMWQVLGTDGNGQIRMTPQFQWIGTRQKLLLADFDGDGRQEIVKLERNPAQLWNYEILRVNARTPSTRLASGVLPVSGYFDHFSTGDFDGDGDQEVVTRFKPSRSALAYYLIQATPDLKLLTMTAMDVTKPGSVEVPTVLDADGDGRDELVFKDFRNYLMLELTPGGKWTLRQQTIVQGATSFWVPQHAMVLDANGDGYDDFVVPDTLTSHALWLNNGKVFVRAASIDTRGARIGSFANADSLTTDLDGDGRDEMLFLKRTSTGQELVTAVYWTGSGLDFRDLDLRLANGSRPDLRGRYEVLVAADVNDDGTHEIFDSRRRMFVRDGTRGGVITAIRSGLHGGREGGAPADVRIAYTWASRASVYTAAATGACASEQVCGTPPLYLVSAVDLGNGRPGSVKRVEFTYRDARFDRSGRGFLGFYERVETEPATDLRRTTVTDHSTFVRELHTYPYADRPKSVTQTATTSAGTVTRSVEYSFQHRLVNGGRSFFAFPVTRTDVEKKAADPGGLQTVSELLQISQVDDFGNVVRTERVWRTNPEHVLRSIPNSPWLAELLSLERIGPYERIDRTYTNDQRRWLIGLLTREEVLSRSALCEYAAPRSGKPPTGATLPPWYKGPGCPEGGEARRVTQLEYHTEDGRQDLVQRVVENAHTPASSLTTTFAYDAYGHVIDEVASGAVDEAGTVQRRRHQTAFDDREQTFPVRETNAKGHVLVKTYDRTLGIQLTSDGPNGRHTRVVDGFGRVISTAHAGHDRMDLTLRPGSGSISMFADSVRATGPRVSATFDMLGRPTSFEAVGFEGTDADRNLIQRALTYDDDGRLASEDIPRYEHEDVDAVERQYDALGRVIEEFGRQGRVQFDYDGLIVRVTDPREEVTTYVRNAAGQTVAVIDPAGNRNRSYYTAFGQLWRFYDAAAHIYAMEYDALGRLTGARHPDYGVRSIRHNAFGEVIRSTDAVGRVARFAFDELGRLTRRIDVPPGTSGPERETVMEWDPEAGLGEDRLASTRSPDGDTERFTYDEFGRLTQLTVARPSTANRPATSFRLGFAYDEVGRVRRIEYPVVDPKRPVQVAYEYDSASGLMKRIRDQDGQTLWVGLRYEASGQVGEEAHGNGIRTVRSYWRRSGHLYQTATSRGGVPPVHSSAYSYWAGGNLFERESRSSSTPGGDATTREIALYDQIGRLESVEDHVANKVALSMQYDAIGRVTSKSDVGAYTYAATRPHAVVRAGTRTFTYDANGHVVGRDTSTYTYTPFGRLESATSGADAVRFHYTARHVRLAKETSTARTTYIGGKLFALRETIGTQPAVREATFRIPGPGSSFVAEITTTIMGNNAPVEARRYLLTDHLGSITGVTDDAGALVHRWTYDAFGRRTSTGAACGNCELGFTGHLQDDEIGLVDAGARHYDAAVGQFLVPDPIVGTPWSTQSLNPYAYVYNNPLSLVDPTGRQAEQVEEPEFNLAPDKEVAANLEIIGLTLDFHGRGESPDMPAENIGPQGDSKSRREAGAPAQAPGLEAPDTRASNLERRPNRFDQGVRRPGVACASCNWGGPTRMRTPLPEVVTGTTANDPSQRLDLSGELKPAPYSSPGVHLLTLGFSAGAGFGVALQAGAAVGPDGVFTVASLEGRGYAGLSLAVGVAWTSFPTATKVSQVSGWGGTLLGIDVWTPGVIGPSGATVFSGTGPETIYGQSGGVSVGLGGGMYGGFGWTAATPVHVGRTYNLYQRTTLP